MGEQDLKGHPYDTEEWLDKNRPGWRDKWKAENREACPAQCNFGHVPGDGKAICATCEGHGTVAKKT